MNEELKIYLFLLWKLFYSVVTIINIFSILYNLYTKYILLSKYKYLFDANNSKKT